MIHLKLENMRCIDSKSLKAIESAKRPLNYSGCIIPSPGFHHEKFIFGFDFLFQPISFLLYLPLLHHYIVLLLLLLVLLTQLLKQQVLVQPSLHASFEPGLYLYDLCDLVIINRRWFWTLFLLVPFLRRDYYISQFLVKLFQHIICSFAPIVQLFLEI